MFRKFLVSTIPATAVLLAGLPAPARAADSAAASVAGLEEIMVTARKRSEDILKVPVSVSALTSEDIQVRGIKSVNDLVDSTPGLNVSNVSSGRSDRSFQQISLRGFTPSLQTVTLTASFIDGVPVASATALNSVSDPARIEILKGPQSAYFGRNTFAGAVNVVNKLPAAELGGSVSVLGGTHNNDDASLTLEGPIFGEKLGFRLTGRTWSKTGSYDNIAAPGQTLGDQRTNSGTLLLTSRLTDNLNLKFFGIKSTDNDGPSAQGMISAIEVRSNNGAVNVPLLSGNTLGTVILPGMSNCTLSGFTNGRSATEARVNRPWFCGAAPSLNGLYSPAQNTITDPLLAKALQNPLYRVISPSDGVQGYGLKRDYTHLHFNIDYEFGDTGYTLSSLTGYNQEYYSELADLDNYDTSLLANPANPGNANPARRTFWDFPFLVERNNADFSQELRLSYDRKGPFTGLIGLSRLVTKSRSDAVSITADIVGPGARTASNLAAPQRDETSSIFFGATYQFTDKFKVSGEGRYQRDKITGFAGGAGLTIRSPAYAGYGLTQGEVFAPLSEVLTQTYNNFLPRVIFQYDINNNLMGYFSYSKGVNVALSAFNTTPLSGSAAAAAAAANLGLGLVVQPEKLDNFELGFKGKLLDGRLRGTLAFYHANWKDQLNSRSAFFQDLPIAQGGTGTIQTVTGVANSGHVVVQGIELDLTAQPIDPLSINFALAMNDTNVRSYSDPLTSQVTGQIAGDFAGHQLPGTSKFSSNFGVQYGTAIAAWKEASWFVRADWSWKDKQYLDVSNVTWIKARSLINLRAGITKGPLLLEAFVYNAFNDKNYTSIAANNVLDPTFADTIRLQGANAYLNVGLPELRTLSLKATYRF